MFRLLSGKLRISIVSRDNAKNCFIPLSDRIRLIKSKPKTNENNNVSNLVSLNLEPYLQGLYVSFNINETI